MMNERLFQRIEVWVLDLVIQILSQAHPAHVTVRKLFWPERIQPLLLSGIVVASSFVGLLSGFLFFILTSQVR